MGFSSKATLVVSVLSWGWLASALGPRDGVDTDGVQLLASRRMATDLCGSSLRSAAKYSSPANNFGSSSKCPTTTTSAQMSSFETGTSCGKGPGCVLI